MNDEPASRRLSQPRIGVHRYPEHSSIHNTSASNPEGRPQSRRERRWQPELDSISLSAPRPRAWISDISDAPKQLLRQILGINPFRTSYFNLYRPMKSTQSRLLLLAGIIFAIAAGVPLPIIGVVFGEIINHFPPPEDELRTRLTQLLTVAAAYFAVTWGWAVCWGTIGEQISRRLREDLVERALGMEISYFEVEAPDMSTLLTEKIETIQLGTSEKVGLFIQSASYFVAAFTVGFILNARLTGILLAAIIPTMTLVVVCGTRTVSRLSNKVADCTEKAGAIAESAISGVRVVQAFGISDRLAADHLRLLRSAVRIGVRKSIAGGVMLGCIYFVAYAANALAFWQGYNMQKSSPESGSGGAGTVYAVVFLILDASFVVGQFGPFIQTFAHAAAAGERVFALLDHPEPIINVYSEEGATANESTFSREIVFQDVTFVYPTRPSVRVLDCLNLTLKPGALNGLVGSSGSGKSTIAALLLRFYDPSSGRIVLDGRDIRDYNVAALRSQIAFVEQEPTLFRGTIFDNIRHGLGENHGLSDEDVMQRCTYAAYEANCDFIADLPQGIHSHVGDSKSTLSGGQKQRVALARALVGNPRLLILDEYTSAMDASCEALVLEALKRASSISGRTTVVIAHRLATVKSADKIMVMRDGCLLEEGTHESLIAANGAYSSLVDAQKFETSSSSFPATPAEYSSASEHKVVLPAEQSLSDTHLLSNNIVTTQEQRTPENDPKHSHVLKLVGRCFALSRPQAPLIAVGLIASMISGSIIIGESVVFGNLVEVLNAQSFSSALDERAYFFCLMFFVLALIALCAYSTSGTAFGIVSHNLISRVQDISLRTILGQDVAWFSEPGHSTHNLVSKINTDSGHLSGLSGVIIGTLLSVSTSIFGGIILAHAVAWKIAVVLLAAVPVMLVAGFARLRVLAKAEERHQTAYNEAAALASEACYAIRTVAALGREPDVLRLYKDSLREPYEKCLKFVVMSNILLAFSLSVTYFVYALAYWWGSQQVRNGYRSEVDFFIVLPALLFSAQAAGQMFSLAPEVTQAKAAARSVFSLHDQRPTIMQSASSDSINSSDTESKCEADVKTSIESSPGIQRGCVDFVQVSLIYARRDTPALRNTSITIQPGQRVAFVGRSGAGKSTCISLLERFYDPCSGAILIDGVDIRKLHVGKHRARLGLVAQESDLFPGSVAFNVGLGASPGQIVDHDKVVEACKRCGIHDFVLSLPEGYETECGRNGSRLSGGQRQRIALARALVRDPDILLLDEATSQLDAHSEVEIQKAIEEASKGRTTVVVAHRLASVQKADRIFVFDRGSVVEQGTHDELVALRGIYASMVEAQELG
ncbi:leptomycin B resistance protein pmd1 [Lineolata rhizophorae]|uniref:Leptomycin B resistance protein pmd1 n=1 Tax=Lineolata rhizophorae TaxID=578093 RepID=A0A6A6P1U6_9PEZI|nr:leptomycin B resistance protein pmd1 [Lineolata rhizophorae]